LLNNGSWLDFRGEEQGFKPYRAIGLTVSCGKHPEASRQRQSVSNVSPAPGCLAGSMELQNTGELGGRMSLLRRSRAPGARSDGEGQGMNLGLKTESSGSFQPAASLSQVGEACVRVGGRREGRRGRGRGRGRRRRRGVVEAVGQPAEHVVAQGLSCPYPSSCSCPSIYDLIDLFLEVQRWVEGGSPGGKYQEGEVENCSPPLANVDGFFLSFTLELSPRGSDG